MLHSVITTPRCACDAARICTNEVYSFLVARGDDIVARQGTRRRRHYGAMLIFGEKVGILIGIERRESKLVVLSSARNARF